MKRNNGGFSLVEIVVAMAILGLFATATCTSLVLALRMNDKTDSMLKAQLAVSSAVETLMAEGIAEGINVTFSEGQNEVEITRFESVTVTIEKVITGEGATQTVLPYYEVTATSDDGNVSVTTHIRKAVP